MCHVAQYNRNRVFSKDHQASEDTFYSEIVQHVFTQADFF